MASNIGDLNVSLTADVTKYKQSLAEAAKLTQTFGNSLKGSLGEATTAVKGFIGAWAGMQAVNGVLGKLNEIGDLVDTASGLNITTDALQKLEYAGIGAGVSVEQFYSLLQRVSDASAKFAEGNEDIVDTFKKLGIAAVDLNAPDKTLMQIIDHLNNIPSAAERMRAAIEIGGKGGAQALLKLAATGREELEQTMDRLAEKGLVIGEKTIEGADKAGDAIATLAYEFNQKLKIAIAQNTETIGQLGDAFFTIMPAVLTLVEKVATGFVNLGKFIGEAAAKLQGFETGDDKLKRLQATLPELARQEAELYKKYSTDSSVQRGKPSMEAERTWARLQDVRQKKSAAEKDISTLWDYNKPAAPAAPTAKPKDTDKPTFTPAGTPKDKSKGSSKLSSFETAEEKVAKDVAALLQKSDTARLETLALQTAELEKQMAVWQNLDESKLSEDQAAQRTNALQMYSDALNEVAQQTQAIYDARDKDFAESTKEWQDWAEKQRETARAIEETIDPTARLKREIAEVKQLTADGFLPVDQAEAYIKVLQDRTKETTDYVKDLGMTFQSAFQSAIIEGKGFNEVLSGIVKDIAAMILKITVINPLMEGLFGSKATGGTGASQGLVGAAVGAISNVLKGMMTKSANGNVFQGHIQPFANGGVLTGPTLFPMDGGTGLAGEAGAEAIMPLRRINGRLGVDATVKGGGNTVVNNVTVNVQGGSDPQKTGDIVAEKVMRAIAKQEISAATRIGGTLNPMTVGA